MIQNSFIFLHGIQRKTEQNIYNLGIKEWETFLNVNKIKGISKKRKLYYDRKIKDAQSALRNNDASYFIDKLPPVETWRLYNFFKEEIIYLDIEIAERSDITIIGLYNGTHTKVMVKGNNLDKNVLLSVIKNKKLIVTFNGSSFDIPILEKYFGTKLQIPHIDVKHLCARLNLKGGLKDVEKQLKIKRPPHLEGSPVDAWRAYKASGDSEYLQLLIEYNEYDCINLEPILHYCIQTLEKLFKL